METEESEESVEVSEELTPKEYLGPLLDKARSSARPLGALTTAIKNNALEAMADGLEAAVDRRAEPGLGRSHGAGERVASHPNRRPSAGAKGFTHFGQ